MGANRLIELPAKDVKIKKVRYGLGYKKPTGSFSALLEAFKPYFIGDQKYEDYKKMIIKQWNVIYVIVKKYADRDSLVYKKEPMRISEDLSLIEKSGKDS